MDHRLLRYQNKAQEVIRTAAIRNVYPIVKVLHSDGYEIFDKIADDRFVFSGKAETCLQGAFTSEDVMEKHIDRIRIFKVCILRLYISQWTKLLVVRTSQYEFA